MRHVVVTQGVYIHRIILMDDTIADTAISDGWAVEEADYVPPDDGTDLTLIPEPPQSLLDFMDAIDRGKISIDPSEPVVVPGGEVILISLTPDTSPIVSGLVSFDIAGSGFLEDCNVLMNSFFSLPVQFISDTLLTASVQTDYQSVSTATIMVRNPDDVESNTLPFTFTASQAIPVLNNISPDSHAVNSGTFNLVCNGSGFGTDGEIVVGGVVIPTTYNSSSQLMLSNYSSAGKTPGVVDVLVRSNSQDSNTKQLTWT